ncbi:MAG: glycoside hydrolase family 31 protein [Bacteroidia bacterium]|nr:glycoside hydrolase family 31 protein [Bacteroidia bacterium]
MKKSIVLSYMIAGVSFLFGQLPVSIGNFKGISSEVMNEQYITKVNIAAENAGIEIIPFSQTVIKVRAVQQQFTDGFSYSVIQTQGKEGYFTQMKEINGEWVLRTDSLILKISKNPVRLRFYNHKEELLNEDEPAFGVNWMGTQVTCYKTLQPDEKFIGLGEKTGNLDRRGNAFENWNTDDYGYEANADPLYVSTPFYIGLHHQQKNVYGIFFDNTYKTVFNFGASNDRFSSFSAVDGEMTYYFFGGSSVEKIISEYSDLTGKMEMPPLWSLGFQQCRWSYFPDKEVKTLAQTFRDKQFGGDVIYWDINYMDACKIFTYHPKDFTNPKSLIEDLKKLGFHVVVIVDPGIKVEKGYFAYEEGLAKDLFVKYPDGKNYTGQVWPGWCHFPDFTQKTTREWWGNCFEKYTDSGIEGFWNDMNEPATWGQNFPDLVQFDWDGRKTTHRQAHNVYGFQMARSTYEGSKKRLNGKRPFSLTRAAFSGIQRYSAVWTGDNVASDEHMLSGVRLLNSMGVTGIPFVGCDVGGFSGNCTPELYTRWMSIGAYTPFFRAHSQWNSTDHEPWAWGEDTESRVRNVIAQRYRILPYLYSHFYIAHTQGLPVMRPLAMEYYKDEKVFYYQYENQFMLGRNFLICPTESQQKYQKVYLPEGKWYRLRTEELLEGKKEHIVEAPLWDLPVFVKESSLIPQQKAVLSTMFPVSDTLELHIYKGNLSNTFVYYEDDGSTFDYTSGKYFKRTFTYLPEKNAVILSAKTGTYSSKYKKLQLVLHGFESGKITVNQTEIQAKKENLNYSAIIPFSEGEIKITF